jgi:CHAT domain-containing protein
MIKKSIASFVILLTFLLSDSFSAFAFSANDEAVFGDVEAVKVEAPLPEELGDLPQGDQDVRPLEVGKIVDREIKGGVVHSYQITLAPNQFMQATVDQRGIDVVVSLWGPDGQELTKTNLCERTYGYESILAVVEKAGVYRLQIRALEWQIHPERYALVINSLEPATQQDRIRIAAHKKLTEAYQTQRSESAMSNPGKSISLLEEALILWRTVGDNYGEADALSRIAAIYTDIGEYHKALDYYLLALPLCKKANNKMGEANALYAMSSIYAELGERVKTLSMSSKAGQAARFDVMGNTHRINSFHVAESNIVVAKISMLHGQFYQAIGECRSAASQFLNDRVGRSLALNCQGAAYSATGEYQKAFDSYAEALRISRDMKRPFDEANILNRIALVYFSLGDYDKALNQYTQVLGIWRTIGNRRSEATSLYQIGTIYESLNNSDEALNHYLQALSIRKTLGDSFGQASTLAAISRITAAKGEAPKALEPYHQALAIFRSIGNVIGEASVLNGIGDIYFILNESQKALDYHTQAFDLFHSLYNYPGEVETLYYIARTEGSLGNLTEARFRLEAALTIIESTRSKVSSLELRASYLASTQKYYQLHTDLLMQLHKQQPSKKINELALFASERGRARSLLELLHEARADIRQGADANLLNREHQLQLALNAKAEFQSRLHNSGQSKSEAARVKSEIDNTATELQQVQAQIRAKSPRYAALTHPQTLTLAEIQQQVLDKDTLLLEYSLGDEQSYLWVVTTDSISSFELPKRGVIEDLARHVYSLLTAPNQIIKGETAKQKAARIAQAKIDFPKVAFELSQMILRPVAPLLSNKRLLIVADGALQYVPFAALPAPISEGKTQVANGNNASESKDIPLIAEHEIVNLPSASVLAVLRREIAGRKPAEKAVAILADPVFSADDPRLKSTTGKATSQTSEQNSTRDLERSMKEIGLTRDGIGLARLLFSRREADAIAGCVPVGQAMKVVDFDASRARATDAGLSQFRIIHFATHGLLNNEHPELSGIVLSLVDQDGKPQNGFLRLNEIYNLNLPAELVVLSACQTGLGKEIRGEGLVGLTRGFMYAGAARVMASLWKVDDAATAELMKRVYQKMLGEGQRPAAALRAAQIEMWQQKRWQSPYYWAAFTLQGEWK